MGLPSLGVFREIEDAVIIDSHFSRKDVETQLPGLSAGKRSLDPKDHHFVVEYETIYRRLSCVDLLSKILYAIATAVQGSEDDHCKDLGDSNEKRSATYRIHGLQSIASTRFLSYGIVRRVLSLLLSKLYDERSYGREVAWNLIYRGEVTGHIDCDK